MELDALLPARVLVLRWFLWPAVLFAVVWLTGTLAFWLLARAGGGLAAESWGERARRAWVPRRAPLLGLIAGALGAYWLWATASSAGAQVPRPLWIVCALAAYAAFLLLALDVRRRLALAASAGRLLRSHLVVLCLFAPLFVLNWTWAGLHSASLAERGAHMGVALVAVLACFTGCGLFVARALGLARAPDERVRRIATAASALVGVPVRAVWSVALDAPNAFALPALGILGVTPACALLLDDAQLEAVCLHELGHLNESRAFVLLRFTPALCLLALALCLPLSWWSAIVLLLCLWPAHRAGRALSRWAEQRADAFANANAADERALAGALLRLHEANLAPAVLRRRGTHPDLYERVLAAGLEPPFARPPPPPGEGPIPLLLLLTVGALGGLGGWGFEELVQRTSDRRAQLFALALVGPYGDALGCLGFLAREEDPERAHALFVAAARLDPSNAWWPTGAAQASVRLGRRTDAQQELRMADELAPQSDGSLRRALEEVREEVERGVPALGNGG